MATWLKQWPGIALLYHIEKGITNAPGTGSIRNRYMKYELLPLVVQLVECHIPVIQTYQLQLP